MDKSQLKTKWLWRLAQVIYTCCLLFSFAVFFVLIFEDKPTRVEMIPDIDSSFLYCSDGSATYSYRDLLIKSRPVLLEDISRIRSICNDGGYTVSEVVEDVSKSERNIWILTVIFGAGVLAAIFAIIRLAAIYILTGKMR